MRLFEKLGKENQEWKDCICIGTKGNIYFYGRYSSKNKSYTGYSYSRKRFA